MIVNSRKPTADREPIEQTIHTVAVRRLAVTDTSILRRHVADGSMGDGGTWFLLLVRLTESGKWRLLGRRRTKTELLTLAGTIDPQHLDGKRV